MSNSQIVIRKVHDIENFFSETCDARALGRLRGGCEAVAGVSRGCMRRIYKMIDPHEETRPAYLFHMDTITYSHRSSNGNKYETVIKCGASKVYFSLYLYLRSDSLLEFKDWIIKLRNSPTMHGLPYTCKACTVVDGHHNLNCAKLKQAKLKLKLCKT